MRGAVRAFSGSFTDLTAAPGLPQLQLDGHADFTQDAPMIETGGIFADLDGDGFPEVIHYATPCGTHVRPVVYRYDRAERRLVPMPSVVIPVTAPAAAIDLDGDGALDLLSVHVDEGVAWGIPGGGFSVPVLLADYDLRGMSGCSRLFRAMYYADVDNDGLLDVLYGVDGCSSGIDPGPGARIFLNNATRKFDDRTHLITAPIQSGSSAIMLTTLGNNQRMILTTVGADCVTGMPAKGAYLESGLNAEGYPTFREVDLVEPATGFRANLPPADRGASIMNFGAMGFAAADLDGDGLIDLAITLNSWHGFLQGRPSGPMMTDRTLDTGLTLIPAIGGDRAQLPWGVAFLDLDRDGKMDVVITHGDDFIPDPTRYIGPQSVTAHLNRGNFVFADVTPDSGLGRPGQFITLAVGDLDRDGRPDLVVGGQDMAPRVYRNDIESTHYGLAIELRGTTSNSLGIGAHVYVLPSDGMPEQHHVNDPPASPLATSDPMLFVGLGTAPRAKRVRVVWPSGTVQEVLDLPSSGVNRLIEPPSLVLEPARRRWPADGTSVLRLRVLPRAPDGTVRATARVAMRILVGGGALSGPTGGGTDGWLFALRAPSQAGSTVLEAAVDGTPIGIRPRIWWEPL